MRRFLGAVLLALTIGVDLNGQTPQSDIPLGWFSVSPDQVKWTKLTDGTGRETATIFGDRSKHTLFGYAVRWPPNTIAKAHSHPDTRYVVVLSGTFYHGQGRTFDANKLERRSTGTFFSEPASEPHFGATKSEGAVLYFVGIGPDRTVPLEK
jgi:quercetin dioxygenase-like cupin family protein